MCYAVLTPDLKGSGSKGAEKGGQQRQEKDTIIWSPPKRKRGEGKRPGKDSIKMRYAYICVCACGVCAEHRRISYKQAVPTPAGDRLLGHPKASSWVQKTQARYVM